MSMSKLLPKDQLRFVDPPTDEFDCPICLGILQEPYLTACCGNHFCETCVEKVKEDASKCPLCQATPLNGIIDKKLRRKLNELKVYCMRKESGCEWIGDLGKLEQHLAIGKIEGECQFEMVKCTITSCNSTIPRKSFNDHITNVCQYREFKCEHCGYQATYLVITTEHYNQCPNYPVACPNNCSKQTHPRDQLQNHLASCPEQEVDCTFSEMGCKEKVKRRQLQQHLTTNLLQHQLIMCQAYHSQNETIALLQQDKMELQEQVACLTKDMEKLHILASPVREINWPLYLQKMSQSDPVIPIILKIPFRVSTGNMANRGYHTFASIYSSLPFYSHPSGYKLKLSVKFLCQESKYIAGYLHGYLGTSARATVANDMIYGVSVALHTVDGEYDTHLKWPFEKNISITLLNKQADTQHHKREGYFEGNKASQLTLRGVIIKQRNIIKQEYEQLCLNLRQTEPTKVISELWNLYYNIQQLSNSNFLLFPLSDAQLKESTIYFEVQC